MWLTKPGLSSRSPSRRASACSQTSNSDIAATNYAGDYDAVRRRGKPSTTSCYVLELTARHKRTTYDRIRYWVSVKGETALKGRVLLAERQAPEDGALQYGNTIEHDGKRIPLSARW